MGSDRIFDMICELSYHTVFGGGFYSEAKNMPIDELMKVHENAVRINKEIKKTNEVK